MKIKEATAYNLGRAAALSGKPREPKGSGCSEAYNLGYVDAQQEQKRRQIAQEQGRQFCEECRDFLEYCSHGRT